MQKTIEPNYEIIPDAFMNLTFVFDGREVKLTGRTAKQRLRSGKVKVVWEICPLNVANTAPKNTVYNKWVSPLDLYHIKGDNKLVKEVEKPKTAEAVPELELKNVNT